ncbi:hypothetical protein [Paenibacillus roseipurpureus]|uniref:Uncharacterized protein n=1 Tax=Paenibacillus roseopurpureus TaxID=2918901 RepID=A0AA96LY95_9BACL|nr:hypothetical protein [Paenibacillus sp. MBLB1832]WNR46735.1 hypothetical protein MJB10_11780 [Paenibacillus sp. MBLB1832]
MPLVLHNTSTNQLYTCMLVNHYGLAYYGVKFWNEWEEAETGAPEFLASQSVDEPSQWQLMEIQENEMKICNVKLRNSAQWQLYWSLETRKPEVRKLEI